MEQRILIIEDDTQLAAMLSLHLSKLDANIDIAHDGETGLDLALGQEYNLIILDRDIPKIDGLEVCRKIRVQNQSVQILMLTALSDELDLVVGFETGADDYVGKPFKLAELIARVNSLLRRDGQQQARGKTDAIEHLRAARRKLGELEINPEKRRVVVRGQQVGLTPREFDLLNYLSSRPGKVCTREHILEDVWESEVMGYEHSINTIIKRLRKKIEQNPSEPYYIETVRGVGYRFADV